MIMKRPWLKIAPILPLAIALASPCALRAAEGGEKPPQKIDVSRLTYKEQDVVIPVPSEIFNALDKLGGNPNWKGEIMPQSKKKWASPPEIALMLGEVIANGFIAVQAKDSTEVQDIGRRVIELANALSVGPAVISHCNSISEAAKNGDWTSVRTELDKAQGSVRSAMDQLKSHDESELVSMGGWLRGTQALTSLVSRDYQPDRAELLHQPEMLDTFDSQLNGMLANPRLRKDPVIVGLQEGLKKMRPLITMEGDAPIPQKSVEQVHDLSSELVKTIAP
jgi:hypothetical protein